MYIYIFEIKFFNLRIKFFINKKYIITVAAPESDELLIYHLFELIRADLNLNYCSI